LFEGGKPVRVGVLSLLLTFSSRSLLYRDRLSGRLRNSLDAFPFETNRLFISSGSRRLSAVYVSAGEHAPVFLICHGIGERVEYWATVQSLLESMGVSSLAVNYSGYGESSGSVSAAHCEEDAIAAYNELLSRGHRSIFLLGFSLGTGVVGAIASRIEPDGVILCEGFSTLRDAGMAMGLPRWLTHLVPDVWQTIRRVRELEVPILVVHSDEDRLFPLSMAKRVVEACGRHGELLVANGFAHNAPIFAPTESYWQPIAGWAKRRSSEEVAVMRS
jgi:alpha-beta hydrolase superfamily lysophospholipase